MLPNLNRTQRVGPFSKPRPMNAHDAGLKASKQEVHPSGPGVLAKHTNTMRSVVKSHMMGSGGSQI